LGLSDYYHSNSSLQPAVEALVPSSLTNPTSITQYLGIKDWYSLHYLSTCSGSFQPSITDPSILTSNKINITCIRRNAGYIFTISSILREELHSSVVGIADEVTQASYYTASWIALWLIGIVAAVVEMFIYLPLTWYGTRRLNGYSTLVSFVSFCSSCSLPTSNHMVQISYISFLVAASLATGHSLKAYHSKTLPSALYSREFYVMSFTTMALMFVVFLLTQIEWRFELWTLKGETITIYRKPECKSWSILSSFWERSPTKIEAAGRDEEYEMQ
jgi:hypothetical protein